MYALNILKILITIKLNTIIVCLFVRYDTSSGGIVLDVVQWLFGQLHDAYRHQPRHGSNGQDEIAAGKLVKYYRAFLLYANYE